MEISRYFATFGIKVDPKEIKKIDMVLMAMDRKIRAWQAKQKANPAFKISNFDVDDSRLRLVLGNSLDRASRRVVFEISRFVVRPGAINAALRRAGTGGLAAPLAVQNIPVRAGVARSVASPYHGILGAGVGALGMRPYGPLAAGGVAGYMGFRGLSAINQRNQDIMSARIATRSISSMFGGTMEEGDRNFDWLRAQGNRLGFSYMDQASSFNNFMANALGSGLSNQGSLDIFRGFTEFGKVKGIDANRRKLVNQALGQMMGKGTLNMEELKRQMSESLPGTMAMFAQAYQEMIGGNLSGQKAIAKLLEDVPKGNIKSAEILPLVAEIMSRNATSGLQEAVRTSQSEQERFTNSIDNLLILAQPKTETAFSRLFRTFSSGLERSTPLLMGVFDAFDSGTIAFEGFINLTGMIIEGWVGLNDQIRLGNHGIGELSIAAGVLLNPFLRLLSIITAVSLAVDDVVQTLKGAKNTATRDIGGMIMEPLDNLAVKQRRQRREEIDRQLNSPVPLSPTKLQSLLSARTDLTKHDLMDVSYTPNAAQQLQAHRSGVNIAGIPYGETTAGGITSVPISPEKVAYLTRAAEIDESEIRYRRALIDDEGVDPQTARILGNRAVQGARRENSESFRGDINFNADIKITGETTEEAMDKLHQRTSEILEDVHREVITQFSQNNN